MSKQESYSKILKAITEKINVFKYCKLLQKMSSRKVVPLKVHKNENFFGFDFEFYTILLLVMSKY
jgi:hypothetical protein